MTQTELMSPSELAEYIDNGRDIESQLLDKLGTSKDRVTSIVILHVRNITMGNVARVHLVALANVERIKHTDNTTPKLKESIVLNNSISTLTKVLSHIWQMQTGQDVEQDRIPSTLDSKLTRILQSVLVPQTLVSMFVTIYPLEKNYEDVLSAVRLPNRIKGVHYEGHPAKVVFSPTSSIWSQSGVDMKEFQRQADIVKQLAEENIQLKARVDQVKVDYNGKFLKLKDLLGLDFMTSIDDVSKAEPHTQMMRDIKKVRDSKLRAMHLEAENRELEERIREQERQHEEDIIENREVTMRDKHSSLAYMKKIESLKDELEESTKRNEYALKENMKDRNDELQKMLEHSHALIEEKAQIIYGL